MHSDLFLVEGGEWWEEGEKGQYLLQGDKNSGHFLHFFSPFPGTLGQGGLNLGPS